MTKVKHIVLLPGEYFVSFAYPQGFGNNWIEVKERTALPDIEKILAERHECQKVIIMSYQKAEIGEFMRK